MNRFCKFISVVLVTSIITSSPIFAGGGFSGGSSGGGTPSGSDTQFQFNNASSFGAVPSMTYNATTKQVAYTEQQYFDKVYAWNGVATYTDLTTESKTTFGTAQSFLATSDATHYLYVGSSSTFSGLTIGLKATLTAANTLEALYWDGSAWTTLSPTDTTTTFRNNGTITWSVPGNWATTAVNSQTYYWVRLRVTSAPSTAPSLWFVRPYANDAFRVFSSVSDTTPAFKIDANGKPMVNGYALSTTPTVVVATSTSRHKETADFICPGAKDQVCINNAIASCPSGACRVVLLEGTYSTNASITPMRSQLEFIGVGSGKTIIKPSANFNASMIEDTTTGTTGNPLYDITFSDIEFDGTNQTKSAATSNKAIFIKYMRRVTVKNCYFHDTGATALGIDFLDGSFIANNYFKNNGYASASTGNSGIGIGTGDGGDEPNIIMGNIVIGSGVANLLLESQAAVESKNFSVTGNIFSDSNQWGVMIRGMSNAVLSGNIIEGNAKDGIRIETYNTIPPANITIVGNNVTGNTEDALDINSTTATNISAFSNNFTGNSTGPITNGITDTTQLRTANNLGQVIATAQTIAATNTINADACWGVKQITSAGAVTTSTTNTFTAPSTANNGCFMRVVNVGANNITLDNNANFKSAGGADVVMTPDDVVEVFSTGSVWYQATPLEAN